VGKGKSERYLKDEKEYSDYILKRTCDLKFVKTNFNDNEVSGHELYLFITNLAEYYSTLNQLNKQGIYPDLVELLLNNGVTSKKFLQDEKKIESLQVTLKENGYHAESVDWNEDRNVFEIMVVSTEVDILNDIFQGSSGKNKTPIKIGRGLIHSPNFQKAMGLNDKIVKYDHPPFYVYNKTKDAEPVVIDNKEELIHYLIEEGKKGIAIQRYKGLGEMNPNQLWETTMDPETRTLLQVKVENVVDTDDIFTVLMGDEVEPRRNFIQTNALEVSALDI
ncbi:DNA gyrase subunit B, partial [bacterium]|nr:DNA gyrase subunit B [bacterium]